MIPTTAGQRAQATAAAVAVAAAAVTALFLIPAPFSVVERLQALGLAAVLAASMQVDMDVVQGSRSSMGDAVAIAVAVLLHPGAAFAVLGLALVLAAPVWVWRRGGRHTTRSMGWSAGAMVAAICAHALVVRLIHAAGVHGEVALLLRVAGAGAGFLAVQTVAVALEARSTRRRTAHLPGDAGRARLPLLGLNLAILCAAALIVLTSRQLGPASAVVAAVPLLIIHFSFHRYALARRTYDQAVLALSVVPEVAGHASLGHGERTAFYAAALTRAFSVDSRVADGVITAARIHHIGRVLDEKGPGHDGVRPSAGEAAGKMLSEVPFLHDVADLVASVEAAPVGEVDLRCAIIRVASTFDELTDGSEPDVDGACSMLPGIHLSEPEHRVALRLVELWTASPALVLDAHRAARFIAESAEQDASEYERV
jgi:hypothetical protein